MATIESVIQPTLEQIRDAGLYKDERVITSPQGVAIHVGSGEEVLNFCANNYLGLSSDPAVIDAAADALRTHGFGLSSVRFICGTQDLHKRLEQALARFLGTDDAILYTSCFDANGGLFETLLAGRRRRALRRAQPCVDHRRHPPVQGCPLPLRARRHGRPGGQAQ